MSPEDEALVARVLDALHSRGQTLAAAEGDTGGVLLTWLTARAGSSAVVLGGVVAYHDGLKRHLLGVPADVLEAHGSVSAATAEAMAHGVRRQAGADIGVSATGIAGPGGATPSKPVGLAFVSVVDGQRTLTRGCQWAGNRAYNRAASARAALELVLELGA